MRARKKPVEVEARQLDSDNIHDIANWCGGEVLANDPNNPNVWDTIAVPTHHGQTIALLGEWVIRGVKGEFYPCDAGVFKQTYEILDD